MKELAHGCPRCQKEIHLSRLKQMQSPSLWRQILRTNFVCWRKLADFLELSLEDRACIDVNPNFALNLPLRLAEKMAKGNLNDPLLRQFLPLQTEVKSAPGFVAEPTGDSQFCKTANLLQKYHGRALLICTSACAMHCRYCFRQNFDYECQNKLFESELQLIAADDSLHEIILSGGDPLSLSNELVGDLLQRLASIPHVRRVRFHTRFPIGIPERVDEGFLSLLEAFPKQIWFVIHANHSLELDQDVLAVLTKIRKLGIVVMSQSVLLRNVNDDVETLKALCERLVDNGIVPYYLYQLDRVIGAEHFEVPLERGRLLIDQLREQVSGYAVPLYAVEIIGERSKTPLY